jgi:hypothetical protein
LHLLKKELTQDRQKEITPQVIQNQEHLRVLHTTGRVIQKTEALPAKMSGQYQMKDRTVILIPGHHKAVIQGITTALYLPEEVQPQQEIITVLHHQPELRNRVIAVRPAAVVLQREVAGATVLLHAAAAADHRTALLQEAVAAVAAEAAHRAVAAAVLPEAAVPPVEQGKELRTSINLHNDEKILCRHNLINLRSQYFNGTG